MLRKNFINIIKNRSCWKIDRRKGNYKLPNGEKLEAYVENLVRSQMKLDGLGIRENGNLEWCEKKAFEEKEGYNLEDYIIFIPFKANEICSFEEMEDRIGKLVKEIVG